MLSDHPSVPFPSENFQKSDLADLDGLLVNSENFNQVFIQRTNKKWLRRTLTRLTCSPRHLNKLIDILVQIVTSDRHPEWVKRALYWLTEICQHSQLSSHIEACRPSFTRLISHTSAVAGTYNLVQSVADISRKAEQSKFNRISTRSENFMRTGYVFIDDSDDNFGISPKRRRLTKSPSEPCDSGPAKKNNEENANESDASSLSLLSGGESEEENQDETGDLPSSDDGVFDIEDETSVSDSQVGVRNDSSVRRQANHRPTGASDSEIDEGSASSSSEQEEDDEEDADNVLDELTDCSQEAEEEEKPNSEELRQNRLQSLRSPHLSPSTPSRAKRQCSRR